MSSPIKRFCPNPDGLLPALLPQSAKKPLDLVSYELWDKIISKLKGQHDFCKVAVLTLEKLGNLLNNEAYFERFYRAHVIRQSLSLSESSRNNVDYASQLLAYGNIQRAAAAAKLIHPRREAKIVSQIAIAACENSDVDTAIGLLPYIENTRAKNHALHFISIALDRKSVSSSNEYYKSHLDKAVMIAAHNGDFKRAISLSKSVDSNIIKDLLLLKVAKVMLKFKLFQQSIHLIEEFTPLNNIRVVLLDWCRAIITQQSWQDVIAVVDFFQNSYFKNQMKYLLARAAAENNMHNRVYEMLTFPEQVPDREQVIGILAVVEAKNGQLQKAVALLKSITSATLLEDTTFKVAISAAAHKQIAIASELSQRLKESEHLRKVLEEINFAIPRAEHSKKQELYDKLKKIHAKALARKAETLPQ